MKTFILFLTLLCSCKDFLESPQDANIVVSIYNNMGTKDFKKAIYTFKASKEYEVNALLLTVSRKTDPEISNCAVLVG